MAAWSWARATARPLAAAVGAATTSGLAVRRLTWNEERPFVPLKCIKNESHTHDTRKVVLEGLETGGTPIVNVQVRAPLGGSSCCACCTCGPNCPCPKKPSGCCACCKCPEPCTCNKGSGDNVVRTYNPIALRGDGTLTLLVKKYADSKMGTHLHGLKVGETLEVKGPNRQWNFEPGKYEEYAMIAGGTGITPLIQAVDHILNKSDAHVMMICANKTPEDTLLHQELESMKIIFPKRFNVKYVIENTDGRLDKELLKQVLPPPTRNVLVMVCGRPPMTGAVAGPKTKDFKQGEVGGLLADLGYSSAQVWKL